MQILIPCSPGELIDKITILEIKLSEITDVAKIENIKKELSLLTEVLNREIPSSEALEVLHTELRTANKKIWDTENDVRQFWNEDALFLKASRGSHFNNDERARVKRAINELLGSGIMEEKSHPKYEQKM
ncbi:hypothetical protein IPH92_05225 [Candidatus Kaiserbacteria bacterium]|nr:MAG: hypothetical protein IPH92_05225 [Candidatus Kaiserbacteria bacterium]